jgi:hypothetical protein
VTIGVNHEKGRLELWRLAQDIRHKRLAVGWEDGDIEMARVRFKLPEMFFKQFHVTRFFLDQNQSHEMVRFD